MDSNDRYNELEDDIFRECEGGGPVLIQESAFVDRSRKRQDRTLRRSADVIDDSDDMLQVYHRSDSFPDLVTSSPTHDFPQRSSNEDHLPDLVSPVNSSWTDKSSHTPSGQLQTYANDDRIGERSGILKKGDSSQDMVDHAKRIEYHRGVSFHDTTKVGDDGPDSEAQSRRKSYRDSGYGSDESKNNSMGSQNQEGEVFTQPEFDQEKLCMDVLSEILDTSAGSDDLPNLSIMDSLTPTNSHHSGESSTTATVSGEIENSQQKLCHEHNAQKSSKQLSSEQPTALPFLSMFNDDQKSKLESVAGNVPLMSILQNLNSFKDDPKDFINRGSMPSNVSACTANDSSVYMPLDISGLSDPNGFHQTESYLHVFKNYVRSGPSSMASAEPQTSNVTEANEHLPKSPFSILMQTIIGDAALFAYHLQDPAKFLKLLETIRPTSSPTANTPSPFIPNQSKDVQHQSEVPTSSDLEYTSRCRDSSCSDVGCNKTRELIGGLCGALACNWSLDCSPDIRTVIHALYRHTRMCDQPLHKCPVPMCHLLRSYNDGLEGVSQFLRCSSVTCLTLGQAFTEFPGHGQFTQLSLPGSSVAVPEADTILITTFGSYGNVAMFTDDDTCMDGRNFILKRIMKKDRDNVNLVEVYNKLRCEGHHHITPHIWLHETAGALYVCMDFMCGGTLEEYLDNRLFLRPDEATYILQQILDAVAFLHNLQVIYLYWTASNILFRDTYHGHVYLSNLSMSVIKGRRVDVGFIRNALPPCVVPPELVTCDTDRALYLEEKSDIWGAGCLYAEMLTGKQMWHSLRHTKRADIFTEMRCDPTKMLPWDRLTPDLRSLFTQHCWQKDVEKRMSLSSLQEHIYHLYSPT